MTAITKRSALLAALAATLATMLAACGSPTPGDAVAAQTPSAPSNTSTSAKPTPTSTSAQGSDSPLKDTDPCSLLPSSAAKELGLPERGQPDKVGQVRACSWQVSGSHSVYVGIFDTRGLKDLVGTGGRTDLPPIGRHQAVQSVRAAESICAVTLGVTETSRVDVQAIGSSISLDQKCEMARQAAQKVEPQLP